MKASSKTITRKEMLRIIDEVLVQCKKLAGDYINNWRPISGDWPIKKGCAYLRLSDDNQVAIEKGSLEQQINIAISEAVQRSNNDRVNYKISKFYIEPGITGRNDNRPEFIQMQQDIKKGEYCFVIIKEVSRIARNVNLWKSFFKYCINSECEIFIRGFPFNPNDPAQIFQLDILAAFAEFESNQTSKRVKESNFSAMITSGKFNSTKPVLGLNQLVVNGEAKVGFYVANSEELKTVEWMMRTFLKYGSYRKTLEEINKLGIKNKDQKDFTFSSLQRLLTSTRYIGKWELNLKNKEKEQGKLMPYDKYAEVELPHGPVVDIELWEKVHQQAKILVGKKDKNTCIRRVYPLSGLLIHKDGSTFGGTGAWGKNDRSNYYYNKQHNLRIKADSLEDKTKEAVSIIINNSPILKEAIKQRGKSVKDQSQLLEYEEKRVRSSIESLHDSKVSLNRRLDILIDGASNEEIKLFKKEYRDELTKINNKISNCREKLELIKQKRQKLDLDTFSWKDIAPKAKKIQDIMQGNDPVALKQSYRSLFQAILVGDTDKMGVIPLQFILNEDPDSKASDFRRTGALLRNTTADSRTSQRNSENDFFVDCYSEENSSIDEKLAPLS